MAHERSMVEGSAFSWLIQVASPQAPQLATSAPTRKSLRYLVLLRQVYKLDTEFYAVMEWLSLTAILEAVARLLLGERFLPNGDQLMDLANASATTCSAG